MISESTQLIGICSTVNKELQANRCIYWGSSSFKRYE